MGPLQSSSLVVDLPQVSERPAAVVTTPDPLGGPRYSWLDSIWVQLAISVVIGSLYAILLMGREPLNPRNIDWLGEDGAHHYIGWAMLREDPHWHWPLMHSDRLGYPVGESVALVDVNPWMALPFKIVSSLLPNPFQYFGIEAVLCCVLQFFVALRLFRIFQPGNYLGILIAGLFFLVAPPLAFRLKFHYCLSNHWLLLAALLVFFQAQQEVPNAMRRFVVSALVLTAVAMATNPYIAFQVAAALAAALVGLLWQRKTTLLPATAIVAAMAAISIVGWYALGFIILGGKGYGGAGYRIFSMNLLAPINPSWFGSVVFPSLVPRLERGQYEGYAYLGAGVIALALIVAIYAFLRRDKLKVIDKRWAVPLLLCCAFLTLMALTTKVIAGSRTVLDLDPREALSRLLAPLRSSGRLFWLPYYTILTALLAAPYLFLRRSRANALVACLLLIQFADTAPLRRWVYVGVHQVYPKPLQSPIWHQLGSVYQNLIVLPAWQCAPRNSPGGVYGYRYFGFLAAEQNMQTNSYYTARYTGTALEIHCGRLDVELPNEPLAPDSAYVVTPAIADQLENQPANVRKCHDLDGFILCSLKTDFGLNPRSQAAKPN